MRFICLGYMEERKWDTMPESERNAMIEECFAYDDVLRKNGHFAGGEALQLARNAVTLRYQNGQVTVTDGPYAETKEQLGGILVLEARDMDHAVQLMSKHPGVRLGGPFEIRPAHEEINALMAARKVRVTTFETPSDRELVATRVVDAPRSAVWEAWTSPDHVQHWMLGPEGWTMPVCEIDLHPGGAWHYAWRGPEGAEMEMRGEYREIAPPERLVSTESWGGDWPETLNTLVLTEEDGRTTMTCTVLYPSREARDAAIGTGMKEGWSASYDLLDDYLRELRASEAISRRST